MSGVKVLRSQHFTPSQPVSCLYNREKCGLAMRLFVAVALDPPARGVVAAAVAALRLHPVLGTAAVKWVESRNLHLTLQFLGEVETAAATAVAAALAPSSPLPAFPVALGSFGAFPPHGPPRVIWAGLREGAPALGALREEVVHRLAPLGYRTDRQAYRPHLTVGRVRRGGRGLRAALADAAAGVDLQAVGWVVGRAALFESRLAPAGPAYRVLTEMPLAGGGAFATDS